ncbi:MAG: hypothetical protein AAF567_21835 [Actinomycetota bacterium]
MTQLFDTDAFAIITEDPNETPSSARHLRSIPTWSPEAELAERSSEWRLDDNTIEIGRRGIALARAALKESGKDRDKPSRKAA